MKKLGNIDDVEFVFFAGETYYEYLTERLNCITLEFVGRKVTFDVKQTYYIRVYLGYAEVDSSFSGVIGNFVIRNLK